MKNRILIADDDIAVRQSLGRVLESEDYEAIFAKTGREAVARFLAHRCDLVLLDLNMPNADGWEAFEWINQLHPLKPVIIITARPNQYERAVCAGVDALMEKPLDLPLLLQTIKELLAESEEERVARLHDQSFTTAYLTHGASNSPGRAI